MKSQTVQYATAVSLLFAGLIIGFQAGRGLGTGKMVLTAGIRATAAPALAPADYFPAQYVNQAKYVEQLPAQF